MADHILTDAKVRLTDAEVRTLRMVQGREGKATWYNVSLVLSPLEYPDQDINAVHLLANLERAELIEKVPGGDDTEHFRITSKGGEWLRALPRPS